MVTNVDIKSYWLRLLMSANMELVSTILYPRLYPLHRIQNEETPSVIRLSIENIENTGVYLIENGLKMIVWVGSRIDPDLLSTIFGVSHLNAVNPNMVI